jgi:hypothetical protein
MDVMIREVVSRIRAVDGAAISEKTLIRIVAAVLEAVERKRMHAAEVATELNHRGLSGRDRDIE